MKIAINTQNVELYNTFSQVGKDLNHEIINAKTEVILFENIEKCDIDAFVLSNDSSYFKKATDFIKKSNPYVPIVGIIISDMTFSVPVDIYIDYPVRDDYEFFTKTIFYNIDAYIKTFATLKKLTTKIHEKIEFANCIYDPTRRLLYYKGKEVKKFSAKEGGILEILASNYGQVVKKEVILEKVWHKTDYFAGRSMDVYITYLRNTLRNHKIKLTIKNISGIGLILE